MKSYAVLIHPGHNRVYFQVSLGYVRQEFAIVGKCLSVAAGEAVLTELGGVPYLIFETEGPLSSDDTAILARLSFIYALFEKEGNVLTPLSLPGVKYIDDNISGMMKYTGKTNELFTRLLLNTAIYSSPFFQEKELKILDPIAGKATTLLEGAIWGYHMYGVEIGSKVVLEACQFFKKFLEMEKFKHSLMKEKVSGPNKSFSAQRYHFSYAKTKEKLKEKQEKQWELVAGNSEFCDFYFKKNTFHVIAGDLPYGVQHGNVTNENQSSFTRSPRALLQKCLPAWKKVLKPQGVLALSWNTFVFSREDMTQLLEQNGFDVRQEEAYLHFCHRVDQSIQRDLVIAQKR